MSYQFSTLLDGPRQPGMVTVKVLTHNYIFPSETSLVRDEIIIGVLHFFGKKIRKDQHCYRLFVLAPVQYRPIFIEVGQY